MRRWEETSNLSPQEFEVGVLGVLEWPNVWRSLIGWRVRVEDVGQEDEETILMLILFIYGGSSHWLVSAVSAVLLEFRICKTS